MLARVSITSHLSPDLTPTPLQASPQPPPKEGEYLTAEIPA